MMILMIQVVTQVNNVDNGKVIFKRKPEIKGENRLVRHIYKIITDYIATRERHRVERKY